MTVETAEAFNAEAEAPVIVAEAVIPESPLTIEKAVPADASVAEEYRFPLSRQMYSKNGVPFIIALEGETYRTVAKSYHLFLKEVLRYNDLLSEGILLPGTVVYLQPKKKEAPKGLDKYIVSSDEETLHAICQRFAVKEKSIRKINGFGDDYVVREGDEIKLRRK